MLSCFFEPESVAIVGASNNPGKVGFVILNNLATLGFSGKVYPINSAETKTAGLACYASLMDVPEPVELVITATPARSVPDIALQAARRGDVKGLIVLGAGFAETCTAEGVALQEELIAIAREAGIRVIGPNCVGIINTSASFNATFHPPVSLRRGGVSVLSQSGALGASLVLLAQTQPSPLYLAKEAHVGNMSDVTTLELLEYLGRDEATKVILMYMESVPDGRAFIDVAGKIAPRKPILALKVGKSELGAGAAFSHTGALAGRDKVYEAAFRRCGVTRMDTVRDMIDGAKALCLLPPIRGSRVAILTEAGGPGAIAMDELAKRPELTLARVSDAARKAIAAAVPPMSAIDRPRGYFDITAAAMEREHALALEALLADEGVDGVVLISVPPTFLPPENLARAIIEVVGRGGRKPVSVCLLAGGWVQEARRMFEEANIPTYDTPEQAVGALACLVRCRKESGA